MKNRRVWHEPYNIIYLDPAWHYNARNNKDTRFGLGMSRYPGMKLADLMKLQVADIAADDCAMFIWCTTPRMPWLFPLLEAFGFTYINKAFNWIKLSKEGRPKKLASHYTGSNSEDCFLAARGRIFPMVKDRGVNQIIFTKGKMKHSRKPPETRDRIVRLFGNLPRIELFATERTRGWDALGFDIDGKDLNHTLPALARSIRRDLERKAA